jgi:hypothetical protein
MVNPSKPGDLFNFMFPIASEHSVSVTSLSQSNFSLSFKILSNFVSKIYIFYEISSGFFRRIKFFIVVLNCVVNRRILQSILGEIKNCSYGNL